MMSLPTAEEREGEEEEGEFVLTKEGKDFSFFLNFLFRLSSLALFFLDFFVQIIINFPIVTSHYFPSLIFTFIEIARFRNAPRSLVTRANTRNTHSCLEALAEDTIAT